MINVEAYLRVLLVTLTLTLTPCISSTKAAADVTIDASVVCGDISQSDRETQLFALKDVTEEKHVFSKVADRNATPVYSWLPMGKYRTDFNGRLNIAANVTDHNFSMLILRFRSVDCGKTGEKLPFCSIHNEHYSQFAIPKSELGLGTTYSTTLNLHNYCIYGTNTPSRLVRGRITCNGNPLQHTGVALLSYAARTTSDADTSTLARTLTNADGEYELNGHFVVHESVSFEPQLFIHRANCLSKQVTGMVRLENDGERRAAWRTIDRDIDVATYSEWTKYPEVPVRLVGTFKCNGAPLANQPIALFEDFEGMQNKLGSTTTDSEGRYDISGSNTGPVLQAKLMIPSGSCSTDCGPVVEVWLHSLRNVVSRNCKTIDIHRYCTDQKLWLDKEGKVPDSVLASGNCPSVL